MASLAVASTLPVDDATIALALCLEVASTCKREGDTRNQHDDNKKI